MATYTTNYNLRKIALEDSPPDITQLNGNFDTIDATMKANEDAISALEASNDGKMPKVAGAGTGNIAVFAANGDVVDGGLKFTIVNGGLVVTYEET